MPTTNCSNADIPYDVRNKIRHYVPHLRQAITEVVRARLAEAEAAGRRLSAEDIGECASAVIFGDGEYDRHMEKLCIEAYDGGKSAPLHKVIDDLQARVTRPAKVSHS